MAEAVHTAHLVGCIGQGMDLELTPRRSLASMDEYFEMIDRKTATPFGLACQLGALAAGIDDSRVLAYTQLGMAYGRAFQIMDDLVGIWGTGPTTGQHLHRDIAQRKRSFPVVWALATNRSSGADRAVSDYYECSEPPSQSQVDSVVAALENMGAREVAQTTYDQCITEAERSAHRARN
jgi:geranylgeranyl diphosphate synthase type I